MRIGIFYGTSTGVAGDIANEIAKTLGVDKKDVHNVAETGPASVGDYDLLILGASTHGSGDLQGDMEDFLDGVDALDLSGKKVALFGVGSTQLSDTFCDGVGEMYERLQPTGCTFIGDFPAGCYDYEHTRADIDGNIVGLLLDEENHSALTPERIAQWCELIKK